MIFAWGSRSMKGMEVQAFAENIRSWVYRVRETHLRMHLQCCVHVFSTRSRIGVFASLHCFPSMVGVSLVLAFRFCCISLRCDRFLLRSSLLLVSIFISVEAFECFKKVRVLLPFAVV